MVLPFTMLPVISQLVPSHLISISPAFTMKTSLLALSSLVGLTVSSPTPRATKVQYAGVNIAGFDFGCTIDGTCSLSGASKPYDIVSGANALGQMTHFVKDDSLNAFRLPVGWQFLVNGQLGGQYAVSSPNSRLR